MKSGIAALVLLAALAAPGASAGVDVDLGASINVNDHTNLFFSISSRYFDRDRATVASFGARFGDPDELAVALFVHRHCGRPLDEIWVLRHRGVTWWDISMRYGMSPDVWFVPVRRDPGPPYGKAYGYWKKQRHHPGSMVVSDRDARNLVAVRMIHDYYGVPVETAMEWRANGRKVHDLMADEYQRRHVHPTARVERHDSGDDDHGKNPGKGHGNSQGKGNGKKK